MEPLNGLSSLKIALLIDFDNVLLGIDDPGFDVELVVNALRERGSIVMGRCYGDWYRHNRHRRKLMEQGLELVETPAFGPVIKNSADIRIALDGLEIGMTQHHIDTFCLVSGDSDFLPLIKKLQYLGKKVLVICGNRFTSDMLRRNCNEFISYENLLAQSVGATEDATTLEGAFALLHRAIEALRERGAEIRSSTVKQMMLQLNPTFSERNFGCPQFRGFLDKAVTQGLIKLGGRDRTSGEFSVLLPEEDEAKEIETKVEARPIVARAPRERRDSKPVVPIVAPPTESAPVEVAPVEVIFDAPEPAPWPANLLLSPDAFAPAAQDETDDHSTTREALLSRGLRRGKLRFSGKTGRPERVESAPQNGASSDEPRDLSGQNAPENTSFAQNAPADEAPTLSDLEAIAQQVAQTAAEISVGTAPPLEMDVAPEVEAAIEAKAEADAPKKPARRRRRKTANAEKSVAESAPASDEEAQRNQSDADAAGLTIPGAGFELVPSEIAPQNEASNAESSNTEAPESTEDALPLESAPQDDVPAAIAASAQEGEAVTPVPVVEEAPAPKKPARRRRTRKKADEAESTDAAE